MGDRGNFNSRSVRKAAVRFHDHASYVAHLKKKFGENTRLPIETYQGCKTRIMHLCTCGLKMPVTPSDAARSKYGSCDACGSENNEHNNRKKSEAEAKFLEQMKGAKFVTEFTVLKDPLTIECPCGKKATCKQARDHARRKDPTKCRGCNRRGVKGKTHPKLTLKGKGGRGRKTNEEYDSDLKNVRGDEYTRIGEYVNGKTATQHRHNVCGNEECYPRPQNLLSGQGACYPCAKLSARDILMNTHQWYLDKIVEVYGFLAVTPLEEYAGDTTLLEHRCQCGKTFSVRPANVIHQSPRCYACGSKLGSGNQRLTTEEYVWQLEHCASRLRPTEPYVNQITPIEHECLDCGHKEVRCTYALDCSKCGNLDVPAVYYLNLVLFDTGGDFLNSGITRYTTDPLMRYSNADDRRRQVPLLRIPFDRIGHKLDKGSAADFESMLHCILKDKRYSGENRLITKTSTQELFEQSILPEIFAVGHRYLGQYTLETLPGLREYKDHPLVASGFDLSDECFNEAWTKIETARDPRTRHLRFDLEQEARGLLL